MNRVFLLSPARAGGRRARILAGGQATFELARLTQAGEATLGDVFAFCSGLYFRGKLSYAKTFARPPAGIPGVQVITPSRGLLPADWRIGVADLGEFASVEVSAVHPGFADPLRRTAEPLAASGCEVVLLGSIATGKYADCLLPILGNRLVFPSAFVGRGDMSRGGLLLRCSTGGEELSYVPLLGAIRRGQRPEKLPPTDQQRRNDPSPKNTSKIPKPRYGPE